MTKYLYYFLTFSLTIGALNSCNDAKSTGPCDYTKEKFNMRVIDVSEDSENENMYIVLVDFDGNVKWANETHTMSEIRNVTTDYDFIIRNNIRNGAVYTGTVHKKVEGSGNCDEEIVDWNQKLKR